MTVARRTPGVLCRGLYLLFYKLMNDTQTPSGSPEPRAVERADAQPPLPNFIGVGVQRGGTTWVHRALELHPDVFVPPAKEIQYFNFHFDQELDWYRSHFAPWTGERAIGEISPNYYYHDEFIRRIHDALPDAKIFIVFRHPVERAWSQYQLMADRFFQGKSFRKACEETDSIVGRGRYDEHLQSLYRHFPREQVLTLFYDELSADPQSLLRKLFRFLGVDEAFVPPSVHQRYNRVVYPEAQRRLERWKMQWVVEVVKKTPLGEWIKNRHHKSGPKIRAADRAFLCDYYLPHIERFAEMVDEDLTAWLEDLKQGAAQHRR
jgi:hypothetical protein